MYMHVYGCGCGYGYGYGYGYGAEAERKLAINCRFQGQQRTGCVSIRVASHQ
jgi:hypothetical protein